MAEMYLFIKALHIISIVAWMAGMLYLPRLYVYHTEVRVGSDQDKIFQVMERKLLRFIINPAMIAALVLGITLIFITGVGAPGSGIWLHIKLLMVLGLFALHGMLAKYRKDFVNGRNRKSARFFRILNEIPAVLMIGIVLLAVMKPF